MSSEHVMMILQFRGWALFTRQHQGALLGFAKTILA